MALSKILSLAVGSLLGGFARYFLGGAVGSVMGTVFPFGTLAVNILGCFLIGFLSALTGDKFFLGPEAKLLLMTGFCGAFTTFSAFMLETDSLLKGGEALKAFLYIFLSLFAGLLFFRLGIFLGKLL